MNKATIEEIRKRFDSDVKRFSDLDSGQISIMDLKISLEIVAEVAKRMVPNVLDLLNVGGGVGNLYLCETIKTGKQLLAHCINV